MTNTYFSTFISGFSEAILDITKKQIPLQIRLMLDGLVVYETDDDTNKVKRFPFFNNTFFTIHYESRKEGSNLINFFTHSEKFIQNTHIPEEILIGKHSFRIIISKENELQHITPSQLKSLEYIFSDKLKLKIDRANPDVEIWFLERNEGYFFCGVRLTKKPSTDKYLQKGELRPELSWLLNFLSEPKATDVFLDPFAGHGSIPSARAQFPFKKIIASDKDSSLSFLRRRESNLQSIEIHNWDALHLPLENNSIDTIVTDPPWGMFNQINIEELYKNMMTEFSRVLKPKGILVLLTAQKELFEKILEEAKTNFQLEEKYNILVSGKKSSVYKIHRI
jgi:tRNA G10  N-methylase Trm11